MTSQAFRSLLDQESDGGCLPEILHAITGPMAPLPALPRVSANMITTLDGVVALSRTEPTSGGDLNGPSWHDAFLMSALRYAADAVLVGATTYRGFAAGTWAPSFDAAIARGLPPRESPLLAVLSRSGRCPAPKDPEHAVLFVAPSGRSEARSRGWSDDAIVPLEADDEIAGCLRVLQERGCTTCLCEGGPTLLADLIAGNRVGSLFLTVSPAIIGRTQAGEHLPLVLGRSYLDRRPRGTLASVKSAEDMLFLRYDFPPES